MIPGPVKVLLINEEKYSHFTDEVPVRQDDIMNNML